MATEQEELRLTVTLVDNATAGLDKLREQLKDLGGGGQGQQHYERIKKDTSDLSRTISGLGDSLGGAFRQLGAFRGGLVAGAGAIGLFGFEMAKQIKDMGEYTDKIRNIAQIGKSIGVDPGVIRNISDQLKVFGVSGDQAVASISKFAAGMAALQRDPSARAGILKDTAPGALDNMKQLLDRLNAAKGIEDKMNIAREATENVRRNAIKRGASEERAADEARSFGQRLSYDLELSYAGKLRERTDEEKKADAARIANAQEYSRQLGLIYKKWDDIKNIVNDASIGPDSMFVKGLKVANSTLDFILEKMKADVLNPEKAKGAIQERFEKFGIGKPSAPTTPEQPKEQYDKGRQLDEQRRRELMDQKKSTDENTEATKKLTDLLQLQSNIQLAGMTDGGGGFMNASLGGFGGSRRAAGVAGFGSAEYPNLGAGVPGGGTVPRGGGGGGGGAAVPSVDTGAAGSPRMTQGKREVAQIAAASLRASGASESMIAGIFANINDESKFNPNIRHPDQPKFSGEAHYAHGLYQEGGTEWNNYAAWLSKNHPDGNWRDPKLQTDFLAHRLKTGYPKTWAKMQAAKSPGEAAAIFVNEYLKPAAGHRISRTNKYLRGVPGVESYTGKGPPPTNPEVPTAAPQTPPAEPTATDQQTELTEEKLFVHGNRRLMNRPGELTKEGLLESYRRRMDAEQAATTKVEGNGKITVDVNAPKGTNVGAEAGGLFKEVEVNRQTQMLPAQAGPP